MNNKQGLISVIEYYGQMFISIFGIKYPHACFYQFVIDKPNKYPVLIAHFFIANGLRICANLQSLVSHMFYGLTFSHCSAVLIMLSEM